MDFVVLDLPHRWAPWTRQIPYDSDQVVITANPDLASLQHTKNLVDILRAERGEDVALDVGRDTQCHVAALLAGRPVRQQQRDHRSAGGGGSVVPAKPAADVVEHCVVVVVIEGVVPLGEPAGAESAVRVKRSASQP